MVNFTFENRESSLGENRIISVATTKKNDRDLQSLEDDESQRKVMKIF